MGVEGLAGEVEQGSSSGMLLCVDVGLDGGGEHGPDGDGKGARVGDAGELGVEALDGGREESLVGAEDPAFVFEPVDNML